MADMSHKMGDAQWNENLQPKRKHESLRDCCNGKGWVLAISLIAVTAGVAILQQQKLAVIICSLHLTDLSPTMRFKGCDMLLSTLQLHHHVMMSQRLVLHQAVQRQNLQNIKRVLHEAELSTNGELANLMIGDPPTRVLKKLPDLITQVSTLNEQLDKQRELLVQTWANLHSNLTFHASKLSQIDEDRQWRTIGALWIQTIKHINSAADELLQFATQETETFSEISLKLKHVLSLISIVRFNPQPQPLLIRTSETLPAAFQSVIKTLCEAVSFAAQDIRLIPLPQRTPWEMETGSSTVLDELLTCQYVQQFIESQTATIRLQLLQQAQASLRIYQAVLEELLRYRPL